MPGTYKDLDSSNTFSVIPMYSVNSHGKSNSSSFAGSTLGSVDDMEVREYRAEDDKPNSNKTSANNTTQMEISKTSANNTTQMESSEKILKAAGQKLPHPLTPTPNGNPIESIQKLYNDLVLLTKTATQLSSNIPSINSETNTIRQNTAAMRREQQDCNTRHNQIMEEVAVQTLALRTRIAEQEMRRTRSDAAREQQINDHQRSRKEVDAIRTQNDQMMNVFGTLNNILTCPMCNKVAQLPKSLGSCGHVVCQDCDKKLKEGASSSSHIIAAATPATNTFTPQQPSTQRCPVCRVETIGHTLPILPFKDIAATLVKHGFIAISQDAASEEPIDRKISADDVKYRVPQKFDPNIPVAYEKESAEEHHIRALRLSCYAQSQLAQHSVNGVLTQINQEQWRNGVYILFESAVSRVFFETFATTLHGKAGGVNVLVNASQRMLAVQLPASKPTTTTQPTTALTPSPTTNEIKHLLVKVATDGRFTINTAPIQPPASSAPTTTAAAPPVAAQPAASVAVTPAVTAQPTASASNASSATSTSSAAKPKAK